MGSCSEGDMPVRVATKMETIGFGKVGGVSIGGAKYKVKDFSLGDIGRAHV